jgi:tRNA A37 threonylcarbamoyladenosine dehydratase
MIEREGSRKMPEWLSRTERLIGQENIKRLQNARVAVFGVGGVGGYTVEALARSGIGTLDLIDSDQVAESNLNRQILATRDTIGRDKVEVARDRILQINPDAKVNIYKTFYLPETAAQFDFHNYDYVADCIDTVAGKIMLVMQAQECGTPIISSMGAGNKLDASAFRVADIYQTSVCPLAKVMRRELRKRGVEHLKVVYSLEQALEPFEVREGKPDGQNAQSSQPAEQTIQEAWNMQGAQGSQGRRKAVPGSMAFVPAAAGLIMAGEIVQDLILLDKE